MIRGPQTSRLPVSLPAKPRLETANFKFQDLRSQKMAIVPKSVKHSKIKEKLLYNSASDFLLLLFL